MFPIDAAGAGTTVLQRISTYIIDPIIAVIFTLGLLLFFVGIVQYLWEIKDGQTEGEGKMHMVWGLVGMLIMVSVYGIINMVVNTLELEGTTDISRIQNVNPGSGFSGQ